MGAIVWLASYPKSGNTWTRAYLNNLLRNPDQPAGINELDWFTLGESSSRWFQDLIDKPITEYSKAEIAELRPKAQEELTKASQDSVFVKTHNILGLWYDHPLHNMDITVAAIYIVRNPLDVCISMTSHYGMTLDQALFRLAQGAAVTGLSDANVPEVHGDWSSHVKSWTQPHPQMLVLRYEDMKHKPFPTFNTMARFLGLKPPKERVRKAIKFSSFKELKKQEQKEEFKERSEHAEVFFREGKSGQWKDTLSEDQIARLLEDHHEQMARFNYLPTDWEERIAAWHKRIATGEAESREEFDARIAAEMAAKGLQEAEEGGRGADRQAFADEDGAIGQLPGVEDANQAAAGK